MRRPVGENCGAKPRLRLTNSHAGRRGGHGRGGVRKRLTAPDGGMNRRPKLSAEEHAALTGRDRERYARDSTEPVTANEQPISAAAGIGREAPDLL